MLEFDMYNVVGVSNKEICVDLNNVYVPQDVIDHYAVIEFAEKYTKPSNPLHGVIEDMIVDYWTKKFIDIHGGNCDEESVEVVNRLIANHIPYAVRRIFTNFVLTIRDDVAHIKLSFSYGGNKKHKLNLEIYAKRNDDNDRFAIVVKNYEKSRIATILNKCAAQWTEERVQQNHRFQTYNSNNEIGIAHITPDRVIFLKGLYGLVDVYSEDRAYYRLAIPVLEFGKNRIHFNAHIITNDPNRPIRICGAKLNKGVWKRTSDNRNAVEYPTEFYLDKFYRHCMGETDWLLNLFYDISCFEDLFVIRNKVSTIHDDFTLLIKFNQDRTIEVAGAAEGNAMHVSRGYKHDPMIARYKLFNQLS